MSKIKDIIDRYFSRDDITKEKIKKTALLVVLAGVALVTFAVNTGQDEELTRDEIPEIEETVAADIYVDIGGAVREPQLAVLPQGSRVEDAINAAGGLTEEADISSINRAEFLEDGEKVFIPELVDDEDGTLSGYSGSGASNGTGSDSSESAGSVSGTAGGKININTADSAQLQQLSGVGPATAQKIIDYRTSNGRFRTIEDIKNVSGIGDKTFEKLKDYITI